MSKCLTPKDLCKLIFKGCLRVLGVILIFVLFFITYLTLIYDGVQMDVAVQVLTSNFVAGFIFALFVVREDLT